MTRKTNRKPHAPARQSGRNDRLVAFPVAGDSFLLIRGGDRLLVDGGMRGAALHAFLKPELTEQMYVDRIICTHNDSDHAQGLAEMLGDVVLYPLGGKCGYPEAGRRRFFTRPQTCAASE